MRPKSIILFERIFAASMLIGLANTVISFGKLSDLMATDPEMASAGFGSGFLISTLAFALLIPLLLWFFITRRASNVAKWILVVMTALGLVMLPSSLSQLSAVSSTATIVSIGLTVLQVVAIAFLFRQDARDWFRNKGTDVADPNIFS